MNKRLITFVVAGVIIVLLVISLWIFLRPPGGNPGSNTPANTEPSPTKTSAYLQLFAKTTLEDFGSYTPPDTRALLVVQGNSTPRFAAIVQSKIDALTKSPPPYQTVLTANPDSVQYQDLTADSAIIQLMGNVTEYKNDIPSQYPITATLRVVRSNGTWYVDNIVIQKQ